AHQQYMFGSWTRVVSPAVVNDARFNYGSRFADARSKGLDGDWPAKLGLKGVPNVAFPQFNAAGFAGLGAGTQRRLSTPITNIQFVDTLTWVRGSHSLKFGGGHSPFAHYRPASPVALRQLHVRHATHRPAWRGRQRQRLRLSAAWFSHRIQRR